MRLVFGLVLVLGLGLAGFAVYLAQGYMSTYEEQLARERAARANMVPLVDVYIVNKKKHYGERLMPEDVELVRWPENAIPRGAFQSEEELFPQGPEITRSVMRTIEDNEVVLAAKVTGPGEDAGVSARLAAGMRAFTIRVDVTSGVSGFLRPGDRVDVYWSGRSEIGEVTQLIQPAVRIIAIDQSADEDRNEVVVARTVTVQVNPTQAAGLAQAQSTGRLSLALVGAEDQQIAENVTVNQRELLGIQGPAPVEQQRTCSVRSRRGTEVVNIPIACPDE
ncbi:MAG: Flp pilus assembly protein CpaB [Paracoccaceae bacterium]|nr:Flp pilus assembly protein CpaB [Paracoccaceae bacterium]